MSPRPNYFFNVEIICQLRRTGMAAAGTSAIPPLATGLMQRRELSRCAKKATFALQQIFLFDHLVGAGMDATRNISLCTFL